jgi:hypothetical protein
MNNSNSFPANIPSILKCISKYFFRCCPRNQFNTLYDTGNNDMFNSAVFTLGILANEDCVDAGIGGFISCDRSTGSNVGEEGKCSSEGKIEGDVTFTNWRSKWTFKSDGILFNYKRVC